MDYSSFFFFNDTATTEIYTLSLHDVFRSRGTPRPGPTAGAAPSGRRPARGRRRVPAAPGPCRRGRARRGPGRGRTDRRSEEHTSELQSRQYLVCRLLLEKKKNTHVTTRSS